MIPQPSAVLDLSTTHVLESYIVTPSFSSLSLLFRNYHLNLTLTDSLKFETTDLHILYVYKNDSILCVLLDRLFFSYSSKPLRYEIPLLLVDPPRRVLSKPGPQVSSDRFTPLLVTYLLRTSIHSRALLQVNLIHFPRPSNPVS